MEVFVADAETRRFLRANRGALRNLGYGLEALRLRTPLDITNPVDHPQIKQVLRELGAGTIERCRLEVRHVRANGSEYDAEVHLYRGELEGRQVILGLARDTTELHTSREALERRNDELAEFAYRTSHDLRAPLVTSGALLERAASFLEADQPGDAADAIRRAREVLGGLEDFTVNILQLAREGVEPVETKRFAPGELVAEALTRVSGVPGFDAIRIESIDGHPKELDSDRDRVRIIIENLVSNAVKYHDPGEPESWVRIETIATPDDRFALEIEDNGLGIPEVHHDRVFEMFARFHPRVSNGTGLGLYLARQAARHLGGELEYHDTGRGSLFRLTLPGGMEPGDVQAEGSRG